ncbi:MAG: hypothetical protein WKG07_41655 [Hymenobacter sp.]
MKRPFLPSGSAKNNGREGANVVFSDKVSKNFSASFPRPFWRTFKILCCFRIVQGQKQIGTLLSDRIPLCGNLGHVYGINHVPIAIQVEAFRIEPYAATGNTIRVAER